MTDDVDPFREPWVCMHGDTGLIVPAGQPCPTCHPPEPRTPPGDDSDVAAGRCCPHCRGMLTDHNRAVWNAGYAVGQRHMADEGRARFGLEQL